jgi:hypothetical protein
MADRVIPFDLGVEILRGPDAALAMHARRTKLALAAMPVSSLPVSNDLSRRADQLLGRGDGPTPPAR